MSKTVRFQDYEDGGFAVKLTYTGKINQITEIDHDLEIIREEFSKKYPEINNMEHIPLFLKEGCQRHTYNFKVPEEAADNVKDCLKSLGFKI